MDHSHQHVYPYNRYEEVDMKGMYAAWASWMIIIKGSLAERWNTKEV
jgi:hypothetical protein